MIIKIKPQYAEALEPIADPEAEKVQLFKSHMIANIQCQMVGVEKTLLNAQCEETKAACRERIGHLWVKMNELYLMDDEAFKSMFNNRFIVKHLRNVAN